MKYWRWPDTRLTLRRRLVALNPNTSMYFMTSAKQEKISFSILQSLLCFLVLQCYVSPMLLITLTLQPSFDLWTDPMREALNYRKQGDAAFRAKDFQKATSSYTQVRDTDLAIEKFHNSFCHQIHWFSWKHYWHKVIKLCHGCPTNKKLWLLITQIFNNDNHFNIIRFTSLILCIWLWLLNRVLSQIYLYSVLDGTLSV